MRHVVVMVATSYPRFPGDGIGSFMEPIAKGIAARGHEVHLVAPWHPKITRGKEEDGVFFHFFKYAPVESLNVFGYAIGLQADTKVKGAAWAITPVALAAGWFKAWRVAKKRRATIMHGHWVVPGGAIGALARRSLPLVVSLHGSDVFVAERHSLVGRVARATFARASWTTACSDDLRDRAIGLGADPSRIETVQYGVDPARFAPDARVRADVRATLGIGDAPMVFTAGRLVEKKGFEYLIDAARTISHRHANVQIVIAGGGDLRESLAARAADVPAVRFVGLQTQTDIGRFITAADVVAVPSIRDDAGNVDGLPNFALEALASGTPVVATTAGGLPQAIEDGVTGVLVAERDPAALAHAIDMLLSDRARAGAIGAAARARITRDFSWARVAERFEAAYDKVVKKSQT